MDDVDLFLNHFVKKQIMLTCALCTENYNVNLISTVLVGGKIF